MDYEGTIIAQSLKDVKILNNFKILKTTVEKVNERHRTPWLKQWTLHMVEVPEKDAEAKAKMLSKALDSEHAHSWYIDFKNDKIHYIIFPEKVFRIDRRSKNEYAIAKEYGIRLGIPEHQLDFSPNVIV